jgi:hypothetical protein
LGILFYGYGAKLFVPPNDTMAGMAKINSNVDGNKKKKHKNQLCIYFTLISINLHPRAQQMYHFEHTMGVGGRASSSKE